MNPKSTASSSTLARRLMERTRVFGAFRNGRGKEQVDLAALEDVLVRFSQLVGELRWIKEIDINPLLVSAGEIVALDARIILHNSGTAESDLPRLAIRPYPLHYETPCTLSDGTAIVLRSIRPEDEPMLAEFHETLSDRSVYFRYFSHLSLRQRTSHSRLARLCFIDHDREVAIVAVRDDPSAGTSRIIGVGRLCRSHGRDEAEFAVIVSDAWQRRGVGTRLLQKLVAIGREERIGWIHGTILGDNSGMRRLCERVGFKVRQRYGETEYEASIAP